MTFPSTRPHPRAGYRAVAMVVGLLLAGVMALGPVGAFALEQAGPADQAARTAAQQTGPVYDCTVGPLWVNDLNYGSAGMGFYWDPVSGQVWTAERHWHLFDPQPARAWAPLWVNAYGYGSAGMGFYWDPVSGQVWTAERHWHQFDPQDCIPHNAKDYALALFQAWGEGDMRMIDALADDATAAKLKAVAPEDPGAWTLAGCDGAAGHLGCTWVSPAGPRLQILVALQLASDAQPDAATDADFT